MTYTGTNLKQWSQKIREYISDQRPLNLDEMRNLVDVMDSVRAPARQVVDAISDRSIPNWLSVAWQNLKVNIG